MKTVQLAIRVALTLSVLAICPPAYADLVGYWSADSTRGVGDDLPNDQGNRDLDGELIEATYTADGKGHTGEVGDYAIDFEGFDEDYVVVPATDEEFEEITITAWINGFSAGSWAGIIVSRDSVQPIYLGFQGDTMDLAYVWNDNSPETWGWGSGVAVPDEEWTFVALTVAEEAAKVYAGPRNESLEFASNEFEHFGQLNVQEWRFAEDDGFDGARNFAGLIDDVSIWNEALSLEQLMALHEGTESPLTLAGIGSDPCDFDGSGSLDAGDLDVLSAAIRAGTSEAKFDVNTDGVVDRSDLDFFVTDTTKLHTWIGDANLDREFNSGDLVAVLASGKYEAGVSSQWSEGDFDGNGQSDSGDLVAALSGGGYEMGPRAAVAVVPEPAGALTALFGAMSVIGVRRRRLGRTCSRVESVTRKNRLR